MFENENDCFFRNSSDLLKFVLCLILNATRVKHEKESLASKNLYTVNAQIDSPDNRMFLRDMRFFGN